MNADFVSGVRDSLPLAVSVVPFGMILAVTAVDIGFTPIQTIVFGAFAFAGVAQAAVIDLAGQRTSIAVIVGTGLVINLRYLMYSGSIAPHLRTFSKIRRSAMALVLVDQVYALTITEFTNDSDTGEWWYYAGVGIPLWIAWTGAHVVGVAVGARIPSSLHLEFVLPLVFVSLLFMTLEDSSTRAAAAVAAVVAVALTALPFNSGLIVAVGAGVAVGLITEGRI